MCANDTKYMRMLCLANSKKHGGLCIAGREIRHNAPGRWIRPVSARTHEEVLKTETRYTNGKYAEVLDVCDIALLGHQPRHYQQENWLLDGQTRWRFVRRISWSDVQPIIEPDGPLWINHDSSPQGRFDRVSESDTRSLDTSLRLIHVNRLLVRVYTTVWEGKSTQKWQGQFSFDSTEYHLQITDIDIRTRFKHDGNYTLGECALTLSLGEIFGGFAYKLIAAVIVRKKNLGT